MSTITEQQKAYDAGVQDGALSGIQPSDLRFLQDVYDYDGETLVCYLNGVGDEIAGVAALHHFIPVAKAVEIVADHILRDCAKELGWRRAA